MSGRKDHLTFCWEDTGKLEIDVVDNLSATLRYKPSDKFVAKTLAQLRKKGANERSNVEQSNIPLEEKSSQEPNMAQFDRGNDMKEKHDYLFEALSDVLESRYKQEDWISASETLQSMAEHLMKEHKYRDALKCQMLSFYFSVSGILTSPYIDEDLVASAKEAYRLSGMNETEMTLMYFDAIRSDTLPKHSLTLKGSFRVWTYCLYEKHRKLEEILNNLPI